MESVARGSAAKRSFDSVEKKYTEIGCVPALGVGCGVLVAEGDSDGDSEGDAVLVGELVGELPL